MTTRAAIAVAAAAILATLAPSPPQGPISTARATPAVDMSAAPPIWRGPTVRPAQVAPVMHAAHVWLAGRSLLAHVAPRVVSVQRWPFKREAGREHVHASAVTLLDHGWISMQSGSANQVRQLRRARLGVRATVRPDAARLTLHEVLHLVAPYAPEGVVDAVAIDLTPAFLRWYVPRHRATVDRERLAASGYAGDVWDVWLETAAATGSAPNSPAARALRIAMLRAGR